MNNANNNTALGTVALLLNTTGGSNTAVGTNALSNNTTGNHNIALGYFAGGGLTGGDSNIDDNLVCRKPLQSLKRLFGECLRLFEFDLFVIGSADADRDEGVPF